MKREELSEEQWEQRAPLLAPQRPAHGRSAKDHRVMLSGILWVLRTGAPWRDMPEQYGNGKTVYSRFTRWRQGGVWARVLAALQQQADAKGQRDWAVHCVNGTNIRAHQHAAGAKKRAVTRRWGTVAAGGAQRFM